MTELLEMSNKEIDRLFILEQVKEKKITQAQAAKLLEISDRQVRNLLKKLKKEGKSGLVSKKRGKLRNHTISLEVKEQAVSFLKEKLEGFGPTLAKEKLIEYVSISISKETARQWMIEEGLWFPKKQKVKVHKSRKRRDCFGELIQADGSHHRWFGEDKEMVNLTVLIDDATGKITGLHFSEEETLKAYVITLKQHLIKYGRPRGIYTDRSAVAEVRTGNSKTQFHKILDRLSMQLILANSPQAKGRVERVNRTLQDRLLKELRLKGIGNIEDANKYLPEFIEAFNKQFARVPTSEVDAHRALAGYDLLVILRRHETRTLNAACIFQYNNTFFEVKGLAETRRHQGRKVELMIDFDNSFKVFVDGIEKEVVISEYFTLPVKPLLKDRNGVNKWKPGKDHPWKKGLPKKPSKIA